ncbi:MAG: pantetheine-phosphate adenylyltransferase [Anaerolineae bacterium]|nr:pantetheine-phosphate adenylyltransferase [Anaerolineae bacterium]
MTIAIYPGTFDPVHYGHIDIAARAASLFDQVIVGVYDRPAKSLLFSTEERVAMCRDALQGHANVQVLPYRSLTVEFAREQHATAIVRGLRVISDFEFEFQMALTNKTLAPEIEFVCLMTSLQNAFLSASILKEVAALGGDISGMTTPFVQKMVHQRLQGKDDPATRVAPMMITRD